MKQFHRTVRLVIATGLLLLASFNPAVAQPVPPPGQTPLPSNVQIKGRSFTVETAVVVLLIGGALFAVCRSSRRT